MTYPMALNKQELSAASEDTSIWEVHIFYPIALNKQEVSAASEDTSKWEVHIPLICYTIPNGTPWLTQLQGNPTPVLQSIANSCNVASLWVRAVISTKDACRTARHFPMAFPLACQSTYSCSTRHNRFSSWPLERPFQQWLSNVKPGWS